MVHPVWSETINFCRSLERQANARLQENTHARARNLLCGYVVRARARVGVWVGVCVTFSFD